MADISRKNLNAHNIATSVLNLSYVRIYRADRKFVVLINLIEKLYRAGKPQSTVNYLHFLSSISEEISTR